MTKQVLDVQQMQHLQELGLELEETMMYWTNNHKEKQDWYMTRNPVGRLFADECLPAYTLQDVLDALPKSLEIGKSKYEISIYMIGGKWAVDYYSETDADIQSLECENLIDAVYSRLCWCIENKFVETNKNK